MGANGGSRYKSQEPIIGEYDGEIEPVSNGNIMGEIPWKNGLFFNTYMMGDLKFRQETQG